MWLAAGNVGVGSRITVRVLDVSGSTFLVRLVRGS